MKPATKHRTSAPPPPASDARQGHDEMNLAEFPLVLLAKRAPSGMHTVEYEDDYTDAKGKVITRKVTITGAGKYGLPTAQDEEVLVALIYLTAVARQPQPQEQGGSDDAADERTVHFTRRQLFEILGWPDTGAYYDRLKKSLRRWKGVTIVYENWGFMTHKGVDYRTDETGFSLLDNYQLADGRRKDDDGPQPTLPFPDLPFQRSLCSITWNKTPFGSFKNGYLKTLDLDRFFRLPTPAAKRAYRYLDKDLPADGPRAYDLERFACQHVGFSPNYKPSRLRSDVQQTVVQPLEQEEFIEAMPARSRFIKRDGRYQVVFARVSQQALPPPEAASEEPAPAAPPPVVGELKRHGLGGKAARDFAAAHPAAHIEQKIDFLDFLIDAGQCPKNPAGWLRKAIEEDYGPPPGYLPRHERERLKAEKAEDQRRADEKRRQAEEAKRREEEQEQAVKQRRRDHIDGYLHSLPPAERQALEQSALAAAAGFQRDFLRREGKVGDTIRQGLIDDEVLRVHPLPLPQG